MSEHNCPVLDTKTRENSPVQATFEAAHINEKREKLNRLGNLIFVIFSRKNKSISSSSSQFFQTNTYIRTHLITVVRGRDVNTLDVEDVNEGTSHWSVPNVFPAIRKKTWTSVTLFI